MEGTIGYMTPVAFNFAPKNWGLCAGQTINIASNTALFSILGTTYGGNGTTTFALPDLQGRVPIGAGQGPSTSNYALGQKGGATQVTITTNNMPAHIHGMQVQAQIHVNDSSVGLDAPENAFPGAGPTLYNATTDGTSMAAGMLSFSGTLGNMGSGFPISIMQPILALNYCICMYGIFPSRN